MPGCRSPTTSGWARTSTRAGTRTWRAAGSSGWGAPLVARELEAGTFRLTWNQSITRTRWLAVKLTLTGAAASRAVCLARARARSGALCLGGPAARTFIEAAAWPASRQSAKGLKRPVVVPSRPDAVG
jgi:hypothetical protein